MMRGMGGRMVKGVEGCNKAEVVAVEGQLEISKK